MLCHVVLLYLLSVACALDMFAPKKYTKGEKVELLLNKVESDHTQLPYRYHDLPFVCYDKAQKAKSLLLGEILRGDRYWGSNYQLTFGVDAPCLRLCDMAANENGISRADYLIRNGYVVHWSLDGLPGATTFTSSNHVSKYYAAGFPLGFVKGETAYLYNHVTLVIRYHREKNSKLSSIVGFEVYPKSVNSDQCPGASKSYKNLPLTLKRDKLGKLEKERDIFPYTYSVYWREDNSVTYDNRWDLYYDNDNAVHSSHIHWLSLVNSLVLVCLVSLVVAVAMFRLLKSDLQATPSLPISHADSDSGLSGLWKNLVNVVMQSPAQVSFLSTLCASGIQCLVAIFGVIVIFVINTNLSFGGSSSSAFFNSHQGAFFTCSVVLLLASGFVAAYAGIVVHKVLSNELPGTIYQRGRVFVLSCLFASVLPMTILSVVLTINLFVWAKESSNALPFGTIVVLILLFAIIELPLGMLGGILGNRFEFPSKSFMITSYVADKKSASATRSRRSLVMNPLVSVFAFGLIPFGIIYVDLLFIFNSVWLEKTTFYYMYSFLLSTFVLLLVVVGESSIVATYLSLAIYNNPNWQWMCFRVSSSLGWYIYAYTIYYFVYYLLMSDVVSVLIYFAYMALVSAAVGVTCGAVGVITALVFVRKIYGVVKRD